MTARAPRVALRSLRAALLARARCSRVSVAGARPGRRARTRRRTPRSRRRSASSTTTPACWTRPPRAKLEAFLDQVKKKTGAEFAVLIVRTTAPADPDRVQGAGVRALGHRRRGRGQRPADAGGARGARRCASRPATGSRARCPTGSSRASSASEMAPALPRGRLRRRHHAGVLACAAAHRGREGRDAGVERPRAALRGSRSGAACRWCGAAHHHRGVLRSSSAASVGRGGAGGWYGRRRSRRRGSAAGAAGAAASAVAVRWRRRVRRLRRRLERRWRRRSAVFGGGSSGGGGGGA